MISIVVPAFNACAALPMCLASLLAQTFEEWECVIVDDGSAERPDELVAAFSDRRIRLLRHADNLGRGAARATGIAAAGRPFLAWQDADDWSFPGRLAAQIALLESEPEAAIVGTAVVRVDEQGRCLGVRGDSAHGPRRLGPLEPPPVLHPTLLMRRRVVDEVGYRARFQSAEDHDFLSRALTRHAFANLGEPLYAYREASRQPLGKYWSSTRTRLTVAAEHAIHHPVRAATRAAASLGKLGIYAVASTLGAESHLIAARSRSPSAGERAAYEAARRRVQDVADRFVGTGP